MSKNKVVITIPIYRKQPTPEEVRSLQQVVKVLGEYPIVFFCGETFDESPYLAYCPAAKTERFKDDFFTSVTGYSRLLLSPSFYHRFIQFEYLLIYQLDAYVFKNQLLEWCEKGYDYVGAPWIERPPLVNGKPKVDIQNWFVGKVGNGGLSLRKVRTHYRNTLVFKPIIRFFEKNEDMFWGLFLYWLNPFFRRPHWKEALRFAFEMNPRKAYELTQQTLPFGVHAWEKYDQEFWNQWINKS